MQKESIYTNSNGEYIQNNPTWHIEDSPWKAQQILKMLDRHRMDIKTIAEVGCGAGEILHQLYTKMPTDVTFTGYEVSSDAYQLSQSRKNERLDFKLEDFFSRDEKNDLLLVIDVFEHVSDYLGFLERCKTQATYKLFHIPLDISVIELLRGSLMMKRTKVGHLHYFTKETALASLRDTGYEIIDHFYTPGGVQLTRTFKSKLASIPRTLLYSINNDLAVSLLGGYSLMVLTR